MRHVPLLTIASVFCLVAAGAGRGDDLAAEFFEKQVRPILAARCYECHSGKIAEPKGGLRLDSLAGVLNGGDTGPAVVPGKPNESLLIDAINYGELYQMPPKSKLPAEEIAILTKWVAGGAPWPGGQAASAAGVQAEFDLTKRTAEHWCWQPIQARPLPAVKNESWCRQPLDRFILARLEAAGLSPAAAADWRTLIRRAYFDLIGLPPTVEELDELMRRVSRSAPLPPSHVPAAEGKRGRDEEWERDAYEALVDKLLVSPRFGERWARHWLDLVRYAESRGHEFDYDIPNAFEYRDYVIRALNADVPYDQFVLEQVAGDLLEEPRLHPAERFNESIIGTGFWFLGEWCHSPVDIRKDECDRIDNMIDVFSKTFLGLTVACARCHDHKFDAVSQRDYYALAGYLQSSSYRLARFQTWEQDRQIAAELAALQRQYRPRIAAAMARAIKQKQAELAELLAADLKTLVNGLGVLETDLNGAEVVVDYGNLPPQAWMTNGPTFGDGPVRAGEVVLSDDPALPLEAATYGAARRDWAWGDLGLAAVSENDPGRLASWLRAGRTLKTPTFTLKSGQVHYLIEGAGQVYAAVDSHAMINGPLHGELAKETGGNSDLPRRWITHDLSRYIGHRVHLEFSPKEGEDFRVLMVVEGRERPQAPASRPNELLQKLLEASGASRHGLTAASRLISDILEQLATDRISVEKHAPDRAAIANWLIAQVCGDNLPQDVAELVADYTSRREKAIQRIQNDSRLCLAMWDGSPVNEHLLIRGNHKTVGPVVPRRLLEALEDSGFGVQDSGETSSKFQVPGSKSGSGRLELARRLVDARNPLTARVIVNRIWHHLMGRGIVPSVDNFGVLGDEPTHPELLDYLADQFIREGWSLKRLIRSIMLSSTYRQGSVVGGRESGDREQWSEGGGPSVQSSTFYVQSLETDPENLLFHRQNVKRLEGEAIRDAILALSGRLDTRMYGPSVPVYLTPFMQGRGRPKESGPLDGAGRRSIYIAVRRNFLSPMMLAFDTPIPFTTIGRRNVSNVPAQALILMNDPFVAEQARVWAAALVSDGGASPQERIRRMYLAAFSREPSAAESDAPLAFLEAQRVEYGLTRKLIHTDERLWADLGHVIYNTKEFLLVR